MSIAQNMEAIFIAAVVVLSAVSYQADTSVTDPGVASLQAKQQSTVEVKTVVQIHKLA